MNFLLRSGCVLLAASVLTPAVAKTATLCHSDETIVLSCVAGARVASLCASKGASKNEGMMQYRFGSPDKLELVYPATPGKPGDSFKGGWMSYSGGGGAFVRFSNGPFEYTVFSATGKWGAKGEARDVAGVAIRKDGKELSNFVCRNLGADIGELGPDLLQKMGMSPADPDPDFTPPDAFLK